MARYLDHLLKPRQLRIVNALWQHGSVSRASQALGLSQPALTKALQKLEDLVGTQIYERHARGVRPTAAGQALVETSRRVLAELGRLDQELDRIESSSSGTVAVGVLPSPAVGLFPKVLARLGAGRQTLQVRLIEGPLEDMGPALEAGEVDLVVGRIIEPPAPDHFVREILYDDPLVLLARADHPLFDYEISVAAVANFELLIPPVGRRFGQELDQLMLGLPELRTAHIRSTSIGFTREMLLASDMVTLAPTLMMIGDIRRGTVRPLPIDLGRPARRASGITYRADRPLLPAGSRFVDALRAVIAEIMPLAA